MGDVNRNTPQLVFQILQRLSTLKMGVLDPASILRRYAPSIISASLMLSTKKARPVTSIEAL